MLIVLHRCSLEKALASIRVQYYYIRYGLDEHPWRGIPINRPREEHQRLARVHGEVAVEAVEVRRLHPQVELPQQHAGELIRHPRRVQPPQLANQLYNLC